MAYETIIVEIEDHIAKVTLNRPDALNALNQALMTELADAMGAAQTNDKVRCIVLTGSNKAFAALPAGTLANLLKPENKKQLVDLLTYHVAAGAVKAKDLMDMDMLKTVEGKDVTVRVAGRTILINSAKVTTADVSASNGVVHIIDGVFQP